MFNLYRAEKILHDEQQESVEKMKDAQIKIN